MQNTFTFPTVTTNDEPTHKDVNLH